MKQNTQEARGAFKAKLAGDQGESDGSRAGSTYGVHPNQIYAWKKQLLDGATSVFEGGGAAAEDTASAAQVDVLYRQIGQLIGSTWRGRITARGGWQHGWRPRAMSSIANGSSA